MITFIARLIFVLVFAAVGYFAYRAIDGNPRWYWAAAGLLYLLSVPFAMSIGGWIVAGTLAFAGAGLASELPRARRWHAALGAVAGLAAWAAWVKLGDITWIFYPPLKMVELAFGLA